MPVCFVSSNYKFKEVSTLRLMILHRRGWAVNFHPASEAMMSSIPDDVLTFCQQIRLTEWQTQPYWAVEFSSDDDTHTASVPACCLVTETGINDTTCRGHDYSSVLQLLAGEKTKEDL